MLFQSSSNKIFGKVDHIFTWKSNEPESQVQFEDGRQWASLYQTITYQNNL